MNNNNIKIIGFFINIIKKIIVTSEKYLYNLLYINVFKVMEAEPIFSPLSNEFRIKNKTIILIKNPNNILFHLNDNNKIYTKSIDSDSFMEINVNFKQFKNNIDEIYDSLVNVLQEKENFFIDEGGKVYIYFPFKTDVRTIIINLNSEPEKKSNKFSISIIVLILLSSIVIFILAYIIKIFLGKKTEKITNKKEIEHINYIKKTENKTKKKISYINYAETAERLDIIDKKNGEDNILIKKELLDYRNSFIGVIGPPGVGKSSFCSAYYSILSGEKKMYFQVSDSDESFTQGLWVLKEKERRNIPIQIDRDIIDVEGFQIDELKNWKYTMIISFLSSDIIILNRNSRLDDTKKIFEIVRHGLEKMNEYGIPHVLRNILIQVKNISKFEEYKKELNITKVFNKITIKPIYIEILGDRDIKNYNGDILKYDKYFEYIKNILKDLTPKKNLQSVSTQKEYIDKINEVVNGKGIFDPQEIELELRADYERVYNIKKMEKENDLLLNTKLDNLTSSNEDFNDFINRHNIDFSFTVDDNDLYFHGWGLEKIYIKISKNPSFTFKVEKSIFKAKYEALKQYKIIEEEAIINEDLAAKKMKILEQYEENVQKINNYFSQLKFYEYIYRFNSDKYKFEGEFDESLNSYLNEMKLKLESHYKSKEIEKRIKWKKQIEAAKYKNALQAGGDMTCKNGHYLMNVVVHGDCGGRLYWVDGDNNYAICEKCDKVFQVGDPLYCSGCGAETNSVLKLVKGYNPFYN